MKDCWELFPAPHLAGYRITPMTIRNIIRSIYQETSSVLANCQHLFGFIPCEWDAGVSAFS
jgi:hypothetical protein